MKNAIIGRFSAAQAICERPELSKFALAKALLAYCYASQRKNEKALEVARAVAATNPVDEGAINALGCTFKICKVDSDFASLYENVLSSPGGSFPEHFHVELFAAYCRLRDFKKMQQQAQRMHRLFQSSSNSKYLFWAVTSMLLQPDLPPTMLSVAEKMLSKVYHDIDTKRNPGAEEMELYLSTLVLQQKFDLAVTEFQTITSRPASLIALQDEDHFKENTNKVAKQPEELTNILLDLNLHTGNAHMLVENARSILAKYPDQWNVWELLIDKIVFHRHDTSRKGSYSGLQAFEKMASSLKAKASDPSADSATDEAADFAQLISFFQLIQASQQSHPKLRGPALAEVRAISSLLFLVYRNKDKARLLQRIFADVIGGERLHDAASSVTSTAAWQTAVSSLKSPLSEEDVQVATWLIHLLKAYLAHFQTKYVCFVDLKPTLYHIQQMKNGSGIAQVIFDVLFHVTGEEIITKLSAVRAEVRQGRGVPETPTASAATETAAAAAAPTTTPEAAVVAGGATGDDEEGDEDGDDGDDEEATGAAKDDAAGKKKKNRKKKNKNKKKAAKKAAGATAADAEKPDDEPKLKKVDAAALSAVVAKDEAILGRLCVVGNYLECHVYLFYQLSTLGTTVGTKTYTLAIHPHEVLTFFDEVSLLFADGIGGELRTVRPGDTALMTVVSQCRRQVLLETPPPQLTDGDKYVQLLQVSGLLQHALQRSPFAYAFKVDLLETYRAIGNGADALNLFSDSLGVKYIQNDSLSYLLIPTLLETGLFKEAAAKFRAIVAFHRSCRRDTLEMMGKAFEHGNYCKALEMNQFVEESRRSLALSVSHVEGRVMDMITNIMSVMDLEQFYDMIAEENHDDTYRAFEDIDVSRLHNHQDFHLALDRLENCPVASLPYQLDCHRKEEALKARVYVPTVLMQFTYHLLADETEKLLPLRNEDVTLSTTASPVTTPAMYPFATERWAQEIGSPVSSSIQTSLLTTFANLALFVLQEVKPKAAYTTAAAEASKASSTTTDGVATAATTNPLTLSADQRTSFVTKVTEMQASMRAFFRLLLGDRYTDKEAARQGTTEALDVGAVWQWDATTTIVAVSPEYLRTVWSSIRHACTWTSFLWQILFFKGYYTAASEKSPMKRTVAADVQLQFQSMQRDLDSIMSAPDALAMVEVFQNVAAEQARLLQTLSEAQHAENQDDQSHVLRVLLSLLKEWVAFVGTLSLFVCFSLRGRVCACVTFLTLIVRVLYYSGVDPEVATYPTYRLVDGSD